MAELSISEAAFAGFRIVRERPAAVLVWALVALVASLTFTSLFVSLAGPATMQLQLLTAQGRVTPQSTPIMLYLFARLAPLYLLFGVLFLAGQAVLFGAMNRAVFDPEDDALGYFRLGAKELRQFAVLTLAAALAIAIYLALIVVAALIATAVLSALGARTLSPTLASLLAVMAMAAVAILAVRLSLAPALTYATGRIDLFGSWALTRGRFWPILGTYVLALVFAVLVNLLSFMIIFAVVAVVGGKPFSLLAPADMSSLGAFFTRARLVQTVLGAVAQALIWPVVGAPAPTVYRRLTGAAA